VDGDVGMVYCPLLSCKSLSTSTETGNDVAWQCPFKIHVIIRHPLSPVLAHIYKHISSLPSSSSPDPPLHRPHNVIPGATTAGYFLKPNPAQTLNPIRPNRSLPPPDACTRLWHLVGCALVRWQRACRFLRGTCQQFPENVPETRVSI
jgi:hypothetical protein